LNRVELIGNLTRDPELRYTPQGTAVCTFGIATNRGWVTETGEKKEDVEFHRIVAWNKLAELCSQLLAKGRKVYIEGRLQTRSWTAQDGAQKSMTEIVINDMLILDSKRGEAEHETAAEEVSEPVEEAPVRQASTGGPAPKAAAKKSAPAQVEEDINPDDIPF
jgi:single-strand DNA-binding protein